MSKIHSKTKAALAVTSTINPKARGEADAKVASEAFTQSYAKVSEIMRESFLAILPQGSGDLVAYVDAFKGGATGWAPMTLKSQIGAYRRLALGCADAKVAEGVQKMLGEKAQMKDIMDECKVPKLSNAGRPRNDAKGEKSDPVGAIRAAFGQLPKDQQIVCLTALFGVTVPSIKSAETRKLGLAVIEALKQE